MKEENQYPDPKKTPEVEPVVPEKLPAPEPDVIPVPEKMPAPEPEPEIAPIPEPNTNPGKQDSSS